MVPTSRSAAGPGLSADFWKYWASQTVSNLGSSFTRFAVPLLIYKLTGSALNLALSTAAIYLPYLLFGLVIGAWVDRVDRKRLMIATNVVWSLTIALIPLLGALGRLTVWWIYAVGFLSSTLNICFNTAEFAAIPSLVDVENLVTANGRIQASYSAANVLGPLLAGVLVTVIALPDLLIIDAVSFLLAAGLLLLIQRSFNVSREAVGGAPSRALPPRGKGKQAEAISGTPSSALPPRGRGKQATQVRAIGGDIVEGLRYVLSHPVLRAISAMMALVNFVGSTRYAQIVFLAKERLGASDSEIGLLFSAGSIGVVVLSLSAGLFRRRWSFSQVALGALMFNGLLTVGLSGTRWFWLALLLYGPMEGLGTLFNINTSSLRQAIVPNHLLGRIVSIAMVLAWSAIPIGALLGGVAIEWTRSVALVYGVIGVLVFLIPLVFSFTALGHAERYIPARERPL